ncbi:hypothetical protein DN069_05050 [Streptacidiphilus pinicola]|uniref:Uncharacterized protein n=1 Tax=Streptacidiphilus pinicola TaxID=2219663 RepID=A0A2X0KI87_9ACTN|nr:hypothetical protein [Streptacidiphilus pinicola]RAG86759.1 hypothetical protein DN069_05050 [Streptacidiphilus pinicola]
MAALEPARTAPRTGAVGPHASDAAPRDAWLFVTLLLTLGSLLGAVLAAPPAGSSPRAALGGLLFLGSSVHVASSAWFCTVPEVRRFMAARRGRYVVAPVALVVGMALLGGLVPPGPFALLLCAFFAWQFFHFQKQNLGLAALASAAYGAGPLRRGERLAVTAAGVLGTAGLLCHPALLQLTGSVPRLTGLFPVVAVLFAAALGYGTVQLLRRRPEERPWQVTALFGTALGFFLPVFLFDSPYAAVAGLTMAHGFQYLVMMGLVAGGGPVERIPRLISLAVLLNIGLLLGLLLNLASHLHSGGPAERALYGAYLGAVMAHFVVDAGLWRLRDAFPRAFLRERLPYLLG